MIKAIQILLAGVIAISVSETVFAKDFGMQGTVFEIKETPIFEMIRNRLRTMEAAGEIDAMNETFKKKVIAGVNRPPPVGGLGTVTEDSFYMFDPSIVIQEDIDDGRGNLIAEAGQVINPLDHVPLDERLLFIDGDIPDHIELAKALRAKHNGKIKVIFTKGAPLEAMKDNGFRIWFDQGGAMVRRFEIDKVPALVEQDDRMLRVSEIYAHGWLKANKASEAGHGTQ